MITAFDVAYNNSVNTNHYKQTSKILVDGVRIRNLSRNVSAAVACYICWITLHLFFSLSQRDLLAGHGICFFSPGCDDYRTTDTTLPEPVP